jgi:hypothetical protein
MYIRGLRNRIPENVRDRASRAGFREPDWYAGPLVDEEAPTPASESSSLPPGQPTADLDLEQELDREMAKAGSTREMRARRPLLLSRLVRSGAHLVRRADAG